MVAVVRHGRLFIEQDDDDGLTRRIWCFQRAYVFGNDLVTPVQLSAFFTQTRATRRHKLRGVEDQSWVRGAKRWEAQRQLSTPPLPDEVRFLALETVRGMVSLEDVPV